MENTTTRELILEAATHAVLSERNRQYGDPEENFTTIVGLWNIYLERRYTELEESVKDYNLQPHDVAVLMILIKVARIAVTPAEMDHWIDLAGYAATGGETVNERLDEND